MPPSDQELHRLIDAYLDGEIDPAGLAELSRRLGENPAARATYLMAAANHAALSLWGEQQAGREAAVRQFPAAPGLSRWRLPLKWIGLAAAAALVAIWWWPARPAAAQLTFQSGAVWGAGGPSRDYMLSVGSIELEQGIVRFETLAGAVVTVAAPARFTLAASDRIELRQGRLTARMLHEGASLIVKVADWEVRDLGTAFGIDARDAGRTLVSVFHGLVAVTSNSAPGGELRVAEGESLVGRHGDAPSMQKSGYATEDFKDLWPLTVGVNESSKLVEFLPPGPLLQPLRDYRANDRLFLFPEQQNFTSRRALAIDLSPDVREWPNFPVSTYPLPAGTRGNSYLVFFQPEESAGGTPRRLSGTISFSHRILGVVCSDQGLDESDGDLGNARAVYRIPGQRRGLEEADKEHYRGSKLPHDSIQISPDGHSINFDFYVSDEREQMRVIVEAH